MLENERQYFYAILESFVCAARCRSRNVTAMPSCSGRASSVACEARDERTPFKIARAPVPAGDQEIASDPCLNALPRYRGYGVAGHRSPSACLSACRGTLPAYSGYLPLPLTCGRLLLGLWLESRSYNPARSIFSNALNFRRSAIALWVRSPCRYCPFRSPGGAPLPGAPPCRRHRPLLVAGHRQGFPLLVRAPHRGAV
jgi:hypothetical protein